MLKARTNSEFRTDWFEFLNSNQPNFKSNKVVIYCYTLQFCTLLINENCLKNPKTAFNGLRRSGGI